MEAPFLAAYPIQTRALELEPINNILDDYLLKNNPATWLNFQIATEMNAAAHSTAKFEIPEELKQYLSENQEPPVVTKRQRKDSSNVFNLGIENIMNIVN